MSNLSYAEQNKNGQSVRKLSCQVGLVRNRRIDTLGSPKHVIITSQDLQTCKHFE